MLLASLLVKLMWIGAGASVAVAVGVFGLRAFREAME